MSELTVPEKPLALQRPFSLQLNGISEIMEFAKIAVASRLVPKELATPEAAFTAIVAGMEIGLSPMQALQSIAVINGRPCVWGDAPLALVKSHPDFEDIKETLENEKEEDGMIAICEVFRRGQTPVKRKFSVKMAKKAGLWTKAGPWTQYPMRMLQLRARSHALRDSFPDALKGVGIKEEQQEVERAPRPVTARVVDTVPEALELPDEPAPTEDATADHKTNEKGEFVF